jgi:hypothetical protein
MRTNARVPAFVFAGERMASVDINDIIAKMEELEKGRPHISQMVPDLYRTNPLMENMHTVSTNEFRDPLIYFKRTFEQDVQFKSQNGGFQEDVEGQQRDAPLVQLLPTVAHGAVCHMCPQISNLYAAELEVVGRNFHRWAATAFSARNAREIEMLHLCKEFYELAEFYINNHGRHNPHFRNRLHEFLSTFKASYDTRFSRFEVQGASGNLLSKLGETITGLQFSIKNAFGSNSKRVSRLCALFSAIGLSGVDNLIARNGVDAAERKAWNALKPKLETARAVDEQTLPERFLQTVSETFSVEYATSLVVTLRGNSELQDASAVLQKILDCGSLEAIVARFRIFASSNPRRFCCSNPACRGLMAMGFQTGTRVVASRCEFKHNVKPSDDKETMWKLFMPLLKFAPPLLAQAQCQTAFFRSSFYKTRSMQTIGLLKFFKSMFDLQASNERLSILASTATFGFYYAYFAKPIDVLVDPEKGSYLGVLRDNHREYLRTTGNSLIDSIVIVMSETWKDARNNTEERESDLLSDEGNPVPSKQLYEKRNVDELDKWLINCLGTANTSAKVFKDSKYLTEKTDRSIDQLSLAFSQNCLGIHGEGNTSTQSSQRHGAVMNNENLTIPNSQLRFLMSFQSGTEAPITPGHADYRNLYVQLEWVAYRMDSCVRNVFGMNYKLIPSLFMLKQGDTYIPYDAIPRPTASRPDPADPGSHLAIPVSSGDTVLSRANCGRVARNNEELGSTDRYCAWLRILHGSSIDRLNLIGKLMKLSDEKKNELDEASTNEAFERAASHPNVAYNMLGLLSDPCKKEIEECKICIQFEEEPPSNGRESPSKRDNDGETVRGASWSDVVSCRQELARLSSTLLDSLQDENVKESVHSLIPVGDKSLDTQAMRRVVSDRAASNSSLPTDKVKDFLKLLVTFCDKIDALHLLEGKYFKCSASEHHCAVKFIESSAYRYLKQCKSLFDTSYGIRRDLIFTDAKKQRVLSLEEGTRVSTVLKTISANMASSSNAAFDEHMEHQGDLFGDYADAEAACGIEGGDGSKAFVQRGLVKALIEEPSVVKSFMVDALKLCYSYKDDEFDEKLQKESGKVVDAISRALVKIAVNQKGIEEVVDQETIDALFSKSGVFVVCAAANFKGTPDQKRNASMLLANECNLYEHSPAREGPTLSSKASKLISLYSDKKNVVRCDTLTFEQAEERWNARNTESSYSARFQSLNQMAENERDAISAGGFVASVSAPSRGQKDSWLSRLE